MEKNPFKVGDVVRLTKFNRGFGLLNLDQNYRVFECGKSTYNHPVIKVETLDGHRIMTDYKVGRFHFADGDPDWFINKRGSSN